MPLDWLEFRIYILTVMTRLTGYTLLLLLAAFSAAAQEWSVEMAPARKRLVKREELVIYCRSDREIEGCTEFLGELLHCECRRADGIWSMTARAQLVPYMYLSRPTVEEHEQLHLDDLRGQLAPYLTDLTTRRFDDGESCRNAAEFEMIVFSLRMDLLRKLSNRKLH